MKIRTSEYRQFYIVYEDGTEEKCGNPRKLTLPNRTNQWKDLRRITLQNENVKSVGWRTVKNYEL